MKIYLQLFFLLNFSIWNLAHAQLIIKKCQTKEGTIRYSSIADKSCQPEISILNEQGALLRQHKSINSKLFKPKKNTSPPLHILTQYSSVKAIEIEQTRKLAEINKQQTINRQITNGLIKDIELLQGNPKTKEAKQAIEERKNAVDNFRDMDATLQQQSIQYAIMFDKMKRQYRVAAKNQAQLN